jgi:hypothetical protein
MLTNLAGTSADTGDCHVASLLPMIGLCDGASKATSMYKKEAHRLVCFFCHPTRFEAPKIKSFLCTENDKFVFQINIKFTLVKMK